VSQKKRPTFDLL